MKRPCTIAEYDERCALLVSRALNDVLDERVRQIVTLGCTPELDADLRADGSLALAGAAYALSGGSTMRGGTEYQHAAPAWWPWRDGRIAERWKPRDARRDLVRAAALILAQIEVIDRTAAAVAAEDDVS